MEQIVIDTTFLIDLQNERRGRGQVRGARKFLMAHSESELLLPAIALGEYLEGFDDPTSDKAQALVSGLRTLPVTATVALLYARVTRELRREGQLIGANDLWIACTAKALALPVLTRNTADFRRVPGLITVSY